MTVVKTGFNAGFYSVICKKIITPKQIPCIILEKIKIIHGKKNDHPTKKTT
jgi:hypothetical protein